MKLCLTCRIEKDPSEFYKHHQTVDGLQPSCKSCVKSKARQWVKDNPTKARAQSKKQWEKRRYTQAYKDQKRERQRRIRKEHPERTKARRHVEYAIAQGKLIRGKCEFCGTSDQIQGHHNDYSKPLKVRWMCFSCHRKFHGTFTSKSPEISVV